MPMFRKIPGGNFAPVIALNIKSADELKSVDAAWVCNGGVFIKVFPDREYQDPSAYYNMQYATNPTLTLSNTSESAVRDSFVISPVIIPLLQPLPQQGMDIDWSTIDIITLDTEEQLPFAPWWNYGTDTMTVQTEFDGTKQTATFITGKKVIFTESYFPPPQDQLRLLEAGKSAGEGATIFLKYHWFDYSPFYGRQFGVRWRWHSRLNKQYFEHIFTNQNMVLNSLN